MYSTPLAICQVSKGSVTKSGVKCRHCLEKKELIFYHQTESQKMKRSLVLFSGGLDSTTALYWALAETKEVEALTFDYGQRNRIEISMARRLCCRLHCPQTILKINLNQIGGSALTDKNLALPHFERIEAIRQIFPSTYVPFRNGILLSLAAAWAEVNIFQEIICGFHIIDSPDYPDTRKEFIQAMEKAINLGTRSGFTGKRLKILSPFLTMKKSAIIKLGLSLGADYSFSISCYAGREIPCHKCSACLLRQQAWKEAGQKDHLLLRLKKEGKI